MLPSHISMFWQQFYGLQLTYKLGQETKCDNYRQRNFGNIIF